MNNVIFDRRTERGTVTSTRPGAVWSDWQGDHERWLFVSAHDDDIVFGAGLTLLAAIQKKISTYAAVFSNGEMGYCSFAHRGKIAEIRKAETLESFRRLGMPRKHLYQFGFGDGCLFARAGRAWATEGDPNAIEGGTGLQNTMTWLLRQVCPTRIFLHNRADIHPDHRAVHTDMVISIFHAQGTIWPELGKPIKKIPKLYEYATYSDFVTPPTMRTRVSPEIVEKRLNACAAFESQTQVELILDGLRRAGGNEYILEMEFDIIKPGKYDDIF